MCGCRVAFEGSKEAYPSSSGEEDDFRFLAEQLESMDTDDPEREAPDDAAQPYHAAPAPQPYEYPELYAQPQQPVQRPYENVTAYTARTPRPVQYPAAAEKESEVARDFDDGYIDQPDQPQGRYQRTTAGKRIGSILLCILTAAMLLYTVMNVAMRLTLTEKNIRQATDGDKLISQTLIADTGETTAVNYLRELIGSDNMAQYGITDETLRSVLRSGRISTLADNVLSDYAQYLFNDKEPTHLNAAYIAGELERFNEDLSTAVGYPIRAFNSAKVTERINGGDLSFLSIDGEGGYFYRHYDVNPKFPATFASLPILIICAVIAALCIVMIFVINSANLPAGLSFNGVVMIIIGCFSVLTAIGCFVLTFIKEIWIVTDLLRQTALWTGVISAVLLLMGVLMTAIAGVLRKKAKNAALSAAD